MEKKKRPGLEKSSRVIKNENLQEPGFESGQANDLFLRSFDLVPQATVLTDNKFVLFRSNLAAERLFKQKARILFGQSIFDILKFCFTNTEEGLLSLINQPSSQIRTFAKSLQTEHDFDITIIPVSSHSVNYYMFQINEISSIAFDNVSADFDISSGKEDIVMLSTGFPADFAFNLDNSFLRTIIDSLPHPFYVIDAVLQKTLIRNLAAIRFESSLSTAHCYMKKKPESCIGNVSTCALSAVISSATAVRIEHEFIHKSGEKLFHEVFGYPVFSNDGSLKFVIQYSIDITERKRNETELRGYQVVLDNLMKNLPGMAFRCLNEVNWTMEYVSPGCKRLTGFKASELINNKKTHYGDLIHKDDRERVWDEVQVAVRRHRFYRIEYRIVTRNGRIKWVLEQGKGIYDKHDVLVRLEGLVSDITEGKNAELLLKRELTINQGIAAIGIELLNDSVKPARVAYLVQYYTRLFTGSPFSLLISPSSEGGNSYMYFFEEGSEKKTSKKLKMHEPKPGVVDGLIEQLIAKHQPTIINEPGSKVRIPGLSPDELTFSRLLSVPSSINNRYTGIIMLANSEKDYSEETVAVVQRFINMFVLAIYRLKAEETLQLAKEKAEESDRLKSIFLSNMSHEIRTPMNAIVGFAEMLQDSELSISEKDRFLDVIIKSGDNLLRLINDIIDISTIEARQIKIIYSDCYINEMLNDLEVFFNKELIRLRKTNLTFYIQPGIPDSNFAIYTDALRLRQILTNLAGNAIKFTDEGFIEIGYRINKDNVEFYVRDSGIGIPVEEQKMIFERFGQVRKTASRNLSGTGLGLTISKNLVELLGGTMRLDSFPDEGATFWFTIPLKVCGRSLTHFAEIDLTSRPVIDLSGKCILVVEDVDTNYFYISTLLEKLNCRVVRASNGLKAIEICKADFSVDLVLMDIELPLMNGYEATRLIKEIRPDLPVIAQTAFAMVGERERSVEAGCDDYIAKPIRKEVLLESIARFI